MESLEQIRDHARAVGRAHLAALQLLDAAEQDGVSLNSDFFSPRVIRQFDQIGLDISEVPKVGARLVFQTLFLRKCEEIGLALRDLSLDDAPSYVTALRAVKETLSGAQASDQEVGLVELLHATAAVTEKAIIGHEGSLDPMYHPLHRNVAEALRDPLNFYYAPDGWQESASYQWYSRFLEAADWAYMLKEAPLQMISRNEQHQVLAASRSL